MSEAQLAVQFAGPLVTIQDGGRTGYLRYGVPASGPMDRVAFAAANAALGNPLTQTAIEISLGGLVLECRVGAITLAIAGGDFAIEHAGTKLMGWVALTLQQGEKLTIRGGQKGSWTYMAFAGNCQAQSWLSHTATLSTSGFGGGVLQAGQTITVEAAQVLGNRVGDIQKPDFVSKNTTGSTNKNSHKNTEQAFRVVMGPQDHWFKPTALEAFLGTTYQVTSHFDRMGMRLSGATLPLNEALSIPSEPIVRGSVQVSGEAVPTVLLADHQTTGGYPKIATLISTDVNRLVQLRSGDSVAFEAISATEAVAIARERSLNIANYLHTIATPKATLAQRLMSENLISGVVYDSPLRNEY